MTDEQTRPGPGTLALALIVILAAGLGVGCGGCDETRPNVVIVVIDTLRADHLSHYGYERNTAAGLDGLAAQATRFTGCYAPASWTAPTVASLFSGLFPDRHGARMWGDTLSDEVLTLAELLEANGWYTVGFSFNRHVSSKTGFDQGFDVFDGFLRAECYYPDISEMRERATAWLQTRPNRPFMLYLHPMNVHGPYKVPEQHREDLLGRPPARGFKYYDGLMEAIVKGDDLQLRAEVTPAYLASLGDTYDTAIRYTTDQLGMFFAFLREQNIWNNSLVIVTADHGEELFDHGGFSHGYSLFEEVLRVPLYVKLPHQTNSRVVHSRVSIMDILPTLVDLLGLEGASRQCDGRSLGPLLRNHATAEQPRDLLFAQHWPGRCVARSLLTGKYKLIAIDSNYEALHNEIRLFDLESDPKEQHDLSEVMPELSGEMMGLLRTRFRRVNEQTVSGTENVLDEMDQERLKALGYSS